MQIREQKFSWYAVPEDIKSLLILAAKSWEDRTLSEQYINRALEIDNVTNSNCVDILVTAYRYFFYKNNNELALQMALKVIDKVTNLEGLPERWENLKPILIDRKEDTAIRLYLNAYIASGFMLARLGEIEQAKEVASKIDEMDDRNEFGASLLLDILTRPEEEEDE
jgi:tetratricopeptide (TPR) repeat protein